MKSPQVVCACWLALWAAAAHAQPPARPGGAGPLPTLPLSQLDESSTVAELDNRTFNLTFPQPILVRELLLVLVRGTSLSIVPDPAVSGSFIGELKNVTVRQALQLVLPPFGLDYTVDGSFVRVFRREPETRMFDINYLAGNRAVTMEVGAPAGGSARVVSTSAGDVFADIAQGVQTLLSERATFNVDRKAGLLQVTDFPERLERVSLYLDTVHDRVHRQVQIDAQVLEVELNDPNAQSLDWSRLAQGSGVAASPPPVINGLRVRDVPRFLEALAAQGRVSVVAAPRLTALNNEAAVVRAVTHTAGRTNGADARDDSVTLGVTPQISADGIITLGLSPVIAIGGPGADGRAPSSRATRETDTIARVPDGETLVVAGLTRVQDTREPRSGGLFGRSAAPTRRRVELLVLLTPKILAPLGAH